MPKSKQKMVHLKTHSPSGRVVKVTVPADQAKVCREILDGLDEIRRKDKATYFLAIKKITKIMGVRS